MKYTLLLFFSFGISNVLFSQLDTLTQIPICNDSLCTRITLGKTKIKCIKACKNVSINELFTANLKNCNIHVISNEEFRQVFDSITNISDYNTFSKYRRKKIIREVIISASKAYKNADELLNLLKLKNGKIDKQKLRYQLEQLNDYRGVSFLLKEFDRFYGKKLELLKDTNHNGNYNDFYYGLRENREEIINHLEYLISRDYINYSQPTSKLKVIKGSSFYHDNDVFLPLPPIIKWNKDQYYTGGARLEIFTDYLRLNFIHNLLSRKHGILSYQGLFFGVEGYTPFIRYKNIDSLTRSGFYSEDRPFASYEYLGLAHYRLHYEGYKRSKIEVRLGLIGGQRSETFQSILHRDQTIKSVKVIGWENQIANGGRYGFNIDYKRDWMLFAPRRNVFNKKKSSTHKFPYIHGSIEVNFGNFLTAMETGIGMSNIGFKERDGNDNFKLDFDKKTRFFFLLETSIRYVIHNSSLEGFGVYNTQDPDPTEDIPLDVYTIKNQDINRWVGFLKLELALRTNRTTLFYRLTTHTQEFKGATPFYGWGTFGLRFSNFSSWRIPK